MQSLSKSQWTIFIEMEGNPNIHMELQGTISTQNNLGGKMLEDPCIPIILPISFLIKSLIHLVLRNCC